MILNRLHECTTLRTAQWAISAEWSVEIFETRYARIQSQPGQHVFYSLFLMVSAD
jgi:hypothetical protein